MVHHSLQSLLNSNAAALQMYTDGRGTPKAYYDPNSNQFHVMSMEAYQKYNEATGKAIEGEKQYMHEMSHPILDQLIEADAEVKERLFNEITALSEEGNEVADALYVLVRDMLSQNNKWRRSLSSLRLWEILPALIRSAKASSRRLKICSTSFWLVLEWTSS